MIERKCAVVLITAMSFFASPMNVKAQIDAGVIPVIPFILLEDEPEFCPEDPGLAAAPGEIKIVACPTNLPSSPTACSNPGTRTNFSQTMPTDSGGFDTVYGGSFIKGTSNTLAYLWNQENFIKFDPTGMPLTEVIRLTSKNPSVNPANFNDKFPSFSGSRMASDGQRFTISRAGRLKPNLYIYQIDSNGELIGNVTVIPPSPTGNWAALLGSSLTDIVWNGSAYFVTWGVTEVLSDTETRNRLIMAKIKPNGALDTSWGNQGRLSIYPENQGAPGRFSKSDIAVHCGGVTAAVISGQSDFGLAMVNLKDGRVTMRTESPRCTNPEGGSNGIGHAVAFNAAINEFALVLSTDGNASIGNGALEVASTLQRFDTTGSWLGDPLPLHCGYRIGAGHAADIAAKEDGNYVATMTVKTECPETECKNYQELKEVDPRTSKVVKTTSVEARSAYDQPRVLVVKDKTWVVSGSSNENRKIALRKE